MEINEFDLDRDGKIDSSERDIMLLRWKVKEKMTWVMIDCIILFTLILVSLLFFDIVSIDKLKLLIDLFDWIFFGCFSIIGTYMGVSTWAMKK